MARHIKYLALAHDGNLLGDHIHWDKDTAAHENYDDVLKNIFASPGWSAVRDQRRNKLELKSNQNVYCMEIDGQGRVFVVVITAAYPIRYIFSSSSSSANAAAAGGSSSSSSSSSSYYGNGGAKLMSDFASYVTKTLPGESLTSLPGGLKRTLRPFLKELATHFDDLEGLDKAAASPATGLMRSGGGGSFGGGASSRSSSMSFPGDERVGLLSGGGRGAGGAGGLDPRARSQFQSFGASAGRWSTCCCCSPCALRVIIAAAAVLLVAIGVVLGLQFGHVVEIWK